MQLLPGIIWSFHIDYNQPPAFYLKTPTLLHVFQFIAIRAPRFDSRYVLLTGCAPPRPLPTPTAGGQRPARRPGSPVLRVAVAVSAGLVVFGAICDESRLEYTVIGDPVNLAAKLDKHGKGLSAGLVTIAETLNLATMQDFKLSLNYKHVSAAGVAGVPEAVDLAFVAAD